MKSNSNVKPIEPLCKKAMYNTKEDALDMVRYINENYTGRVINVYKCDICGFWHLTSKART